jgi:hypothetical protein
MSEPDASAPGAAPQKSRWRFLPLARLAMPAANVSADAADTRHGRSAAGPAHAEGRPIPALRGSGRMFLRIRLDSSSPAAALTGSSERQGQEPSA